ncbi:uncharacterized protein LOC143244510 isoform X2 [Tachypleus tridentatus]|uniref:uncharacterized protein LOC143244510 isoform X2 n=1 Tax=Tachypleus tridentatus TaxID=6853 RepID=UPI003FD4DFB3
MTASSESILGMEWMDGCKSQSLTGCPSLEKLLEKVGSGLAKKIKGHLWIPSHRQALFTLLGDDFVKKYFSNSVTDPSILEPPKMSHGKKEQVMSEMQNWLDNQTEFVLQEKCLKTKKGKARGDMAAYMQEVEDIFSQSLDVQLKRAKAHKKNKKKNRNNDENTLTLKDIFHITINLVLSQDLTPMDSIIATMNEHSALLPKPLRSLYWSEYLLKKENEKNSKLKGRKWNIRVLFRKELARAVKEQGVERATQSSQWKQIDQAVINAYKLTSTLKYFDKDEQLTVTSQVLNVVQVYSKNFQPFLVYWAYGLQQVYLKNKKVDHDDEIVEVAMFLDILQRHCMPTQSQIFALGCSISDSLVKEDEELFNHLNEIIEKNVTGNLQGFVSILHPAAVLFIWDQLFMQKWSSEALCSVCLTLMGLLKPWFMLAHDYSNIKKVFLEEPSKLYTLDIRNAWKYLKDGGAFRDISSMNRNFKVPEPSKCEPESLPPLPLPVSVSESGSDPEETPPKPAAVPAPIPETKHVSEPEETITVAAPVPALIPKAEPVLKPSTQIDEPEISYKQGQSKDEESYEPVEKSKLVSSQKVINSPSLAFSSTPAPEPELSSLSVEELKRDPPQLLSPLVEERNNDLHELWVPYDKETKHNLPKKSTVNIPFDLYIDGVRFIPDNATVVKINGRILNLYLQDGTNQNLDIVAYPELDSPAKCPKFKFRMCLNREGLLVNPDALAMLRVYTLEKHTQEVVVLGSCLIGIFTNKAGKPLKLRVGGHQIRLRHGLPNAPAGLRSLEYTHMSNNPIIPLVTVLVRLLPHQKDYIPAPGYTTQYYRSKEACPSSSESLVFGYYVKEKSYRFTVKQVALQLQGNVSDEDENVRKFIQKKLIHKHGVKVPDLPYERFLNYNNEFGIMILIEQAHGLPVYLSGRYIQCLAQLLPGTDAQKEGSNVVSFLTQTLDFKCPQRSPDWLDPSTRVYTAYDERTVILLSLFGIKPKYCSSGTLLEGEHEKSDLKLNNSLAWTIVPCFENGCVLAGTHHAPLFKGHIDLSAVSKLEYLPWDFVLKKLMKDGAKLFDMASIEVTIWDGHFAGTECPPLPDHTVVMKLVAQPEKYVTAKSQHLGPSVNELLLDSLHPSIIKPVGEEYENHKTKFEALVKKKFNMIMNKALKESKYLPLV